MIICFCILEIYIKIPANSLFEMVGAHRAQSDRITTSSRDSSTAVSVLTRVFVICVSIVNLFVYNIMLYTFLLAYIFVHRYISFLIHNIRHNMLESIRIFLVLCFHFVFVLVKNITTSAAYTNR